MDWTRFDLSGLGAVTKVEFNITGSSDNGYGFSQPAYFAYDDVAVRFEKTVIPRSRPPSRRSRRKIRLVRPTRMQTTTAFVTNVAST